MKPVIANAARDLNEYRTSHVHVVGSLAAGVDRPRMGVARRPRVGALRSTSAAWSGRRQRHRGRPRLGFSRMNRSSPVMTSPSRSRSRTTRLMTCKCSSPPVECRLGYLLTLGPDAETGRTPFPANAGLSNGSDLPASRPPTGRYRRFIHRTGLPVTVSNRAGRRPSHQSTHRHTTRRGA